MKDTLPKILKEIAEKYPDSLAQGYKKTRDGNFIFFTYREAYQRVQSFAGALAELGVKRGDHIGLISDNRYEWQQADMALLALGAIDVPRGCDATPADLRYILNSAECHIVITENNAQVEKICGEKDGLPCLETLICFEAVKEETAAKAAELGVKVLLFEELIERGDVWKQAHPDYFDTELEKGKGDDLACIIFTSGTTGEPKGVMLEHRNFITQLDEVPERVSIQHGDKVICVLPVWHAFQRLCEYIVLSAGSTLCYSKPVASVLLKDFQMLNPQIMPAVPRVFEALYDGINKTMRKTGGVVYNMFQFFLTVGIWQSRLSRILFCQKPEFHKKSIFVRWLLLSFPWLILTPFKALGDVLVFKKVRAKLGNAFKEGVSGGGALPPGIDEFFWVCGIRILEGYGLTETAPVVAVRPYAKPVFRTVGKQIRGVEIKIVDDDGNECPAGKKGLVLIRGGVVMRGYYNKPELTKKAIDANGWFNTGDIGVKTLNGELMIRGRMKDTIVLTGGENVEPLPIEMKMNESRFISQSVVVGQDERFLGALIVPAKDELLIYARENYIKYDTYENLLKDEAILKLFDTEIQGLVSTKNGFKSFERIASFRLLIKPFEVGVELSAKQEIMRYKLSEIYEKEIKAMYK